MKKKQMKRLLETILGYKISSYDETSNRKVWYTKEGDSLSSWITVLKLQNKCKKWAAEYGFPIFSTVTKHNAIAIVDREIETDIDAVAEFAEKEHEAVYEMCLKVILHIQREG